MSTTLTVSIKGTVPSMKKSCLSREEALCSLAPKSSHGCLLYWGNNAIDLPYNDISIKNINDFFFLSFKAGFHTCNIRVDLRLSKQQHTSNEIIKATTVLKKFFFFKNVSLDRTYKYTLISFRITKHTHTYASIRLYLTHTGIHARTQTHMYALSLVT